MKKFLKKYHKAIVLIIVMPLLLWALYETQSWINRIKEQPTVGEKIVVRRGPLRPFHLARDVQAEEKALEEERSTQVFRAGKRVEAEASIINNEGGGCLIAVKIVDGGPMIIARMLNCKEKK